MVKILGPETARVDTTTNLRCHAYDANPTPSIQWMVNGRKVGVGVNTNHHPAKGVSSEARRDPEATGRDVTSDLRLNIEANDSKIAVSCLAVSRGHFGDVMTKQAEAEILVLSK